MAYLWFHEEGGKFLLATSAYTKGQTMFSIFFPMAKNIFCQRGHGLMAPWIRHCMTMNFMTPCLLQEPYGRLPRCWWAVCSSWQLLWRWAFSGATNVTSEPWWLPFYTSALVRIWNNLCAWLLNWDECRVSWAGRVWINGEGELYSKQKDEIKSITFYRHSIFFLFTFNKPLSKTTQPICTNFSKN